MPATGWNGSEAKTTKNELSLGGVARNTEPRTILLEGDESTLRFTVRRNEAALELLLTTAEKATWSKAKSLRNLTFSKLLQEAHTSNRKAVASVLKKASGQRLLHREGNSYQVTGTDT
jgi:hypothetical protein